MQRWSVILLAGVLTCAFLIAPVAGVSPANESSAQYECAFPFETTDGTNTTVSVPEEPERIVTLNPSAAQIMWEIGAEENVVGLTKHAMNLEGADERTNISTADETINPEAVVELEPDLVLAPSSQMVTEELVETLRRAGVTVYYYPSAESIDDVRERTLLTGQLVGECEGAEETVEWMNHELAIVEETIAGQDRPDVLYTFFGFTAGSETFIHELIETSGATNIAAEVGIPEYQQVNEEMVIEENPDWIVLNTNSPEVPDSPAYAETTAIRENQTVVIDVNHLNRPGPRVIHAITELAETFHPDAYAAAQASAEEDESDASSADTDDSNTESSDTDTEAGTDSESSESTATDVESPEEQPGFGALTALVALVVGSLAAKRQSARSGER